MARLRGLLVSLGLAGLGLLAGCAAVMVHDLWPAVPLVIAVAAVTTYAIRPGLRTRGSFAAGWAIGVGYFVIPRPEGDYLIGQNAQGYLLLGVTVVVLMVSIITVPQRVRPAHPAPAD